MAPSPAPSPGPSRSPTTLALGVPPSVPPAAAPSQSPSSGPPDRPTLAPNGDGTPPVAPSRSPTGVPSRDGAPHAEGGILFDAPEVNFIEEVVISSSAMTKYAQGRWRGFALAPCSGGDPFAMPRVRVGHAVCDTGEAAGTFDWESLFIGESGIRVKVSSGPGYTAETEDPDFDYETLGFSEMKLVCQVSCLADSTEFSIGGSNGSSGTGSVTQTPACEPGERLLGISCGTLDVDFFPRRLIALSVSVNPDDGVLSANCSWEGPGDVNLDNETPFFTIQTICAA